MFGKLREKLKKWVGKVSEVEPETAKDLEDIKETIDEELKKEVKKKKYLEPRKTFNNGKQGYEPDLNKIQAGRDLNKILKGELPIELPNGKLKIKTQDNIPLDKEDGGAEQVSGRDKLEPSSSELESKSAGGRGKSFFKKIFSNKKTISPEEFQEHSEDLEMILLENNVALEVAEKIINELKEKIVGKELTKKEIETTLISTLKEIIEDVLIEPFDILQEIKQKKGPYVILFCGINGTGKTTHIAKIANLLKKNKISCVLAAGDTFRAAAVEQLKKHGENLNLKVISQNYGADPAAVGFDAVKYAEKNKIDVVLIDTAGRIHTATNLIREMVKIKKVTNPDRTIFVGESITGNDATDQVKAFNDNIGIDGIILSKADIDEKGGTALGVGYTTKKPILFLGTGQEYKDLEPFDKKKFIEKLGL